MTVKFNRAPLAFALSQLMDVKGRTEMMLDETVVPVTSIAQLTDTPYVRFGILCGEEQPSVAVAAKNSWVLARPGANKVLQIESLILENPAAAAQKFSIRILTAADVATLDTIGSPAQMLDLTSPIARTRLSSFVVDASDAVSTAGNSFAKVALPTLATLQIFFPSPGVCLFGNDEGGIPALGVSGATQNQEINVTVLGREWPLPGQ